MGAVMLLYKRRWVNVNLHTIVLNLAEPTPGSQILVGLELRKSARLISARL